MALRGPGDARESNFGRQPSKLAQGLVVLMMRTNQNKNAFLIRTVSERNIKVRLLGFKGGITGWEELFCRRNFSQK